LLNGSRFLEARGLNGGQNFGAQAEIFKAHALNKIPRGPKRHAYLLSFRRINLLQRFASVRKTDRSNAASCPALLHNQISGSANRRKGQKQAKTWRDGPV